MIPQYPDFTKLDLALLKEINKFTGQFEPYSDFNATSLYSWNIDGSAALSYLRDNLVIQLPGYLDGKILCSVLGVNDIEFCIDRLLKDFGSLHLVPEVTINAISNPDKYKIQEDRDNFDYVYDVDHLSRMIGGKYKKKRNKHNVFVKAHENYELTLRTTKQLNSFQAQSIGHIDKEWAKLTPRDKGDILSERRALSRLLDSFSELNLLLIEVVVEGEVKAFSINEILNDKYAICHFEKALKVHHENIYTFLSSEVASVLKQKGCKLINWEQDLGLEGLRKSKLSYYPVKMLKKYTVRPL